MPTKSAAQALAILRDGRATFQWRTTCQELQRCREMYDQCHPNRRATEN